VVVGQSRATQRRQPKVRADEAALTEAIVRLATQYGRYGYRRIRRLLLDEGWRVSVKRLPHLAAGRAESPKETTQAWASLAQRRIVHPLETRAAQSRVVL
jgi:hypothetical protein